MFGKDVSFGICFEVTHARHNFGRIAENPFRDIAESAACSAQFLPRHSRRVAGGLYDVDYSPCEICRRTEVLLYGFLCILQLLQDVILLFPDSIHICVQRLLCQRGSTGSRPLEYEIHSDFVYPHTYV